VVRIGFLPYSLAVTQCTGRDTLESHGKANYSPLREAGESRGSSAHGIATMIDWVVLTFLRPPQSSSRSHAGQSAKATSN